MKRLKRFLPALALMLIAASVVAFKAAPHKQAVTDYLTCSPEYAFVYDGSGDKFDPASYTYIPNYTTACSGHQILCAIVVCREYVDNPDTDPTLKAAAIASTGELGIGITSAESLQPLSGTYFDPNHIPPRWVIFLKTA